MRMARPTSPFALMPSDLIALQGWLRISTLEQSLAQRARILLLLADGLTLVDVVGLYLNPPDKALVLSVDEKT